MKKFYALLPFLALFAAACSETAVSPDLMEPEVTTLAEEGLALTSAASYTEDWDGRGTDSERCRVPDESDPRFPFYAVGDGWIHWVFATKGTSTNAKLVLGGTGSGDYYPGEPLTASIWHFYTPYFEVDGLTATIKLFGGDPGPGGGLVISDYCPGDGLTLDVRKTAKAKFTRTHLWDIDKKVETENEYELDDLPKIWLYTDGSGDETATWTVDVSYEGKMDSGFTVYGEISIKNISASKADKVITSVTDDLGIDGYENISVNCPVTLPYTLPYGETLECTYSVTVAGAKQGDYGTNSVSVEVEDESTVYGATAEWEFDKPTTEVNKTVNIKDISDLFGEKHLGSVTAPNGDKFTYHKDFAFEDFDKCGAYRYDNTASIVETGQKAEASLKVNVQCFVYESAWAKGEDDYKDGSVIAKPFCDNGFSNWGWTNRISKPYGEASWPLYAGAAQCDTSKGTLVGHFNVKHDNDGFTYKFVPVPGVPFEDAAVYAGTGMFPRLPGRNGAETTAPGHYRIASPLATTIHVIAHVNAGLPDPNFGPVN